MECEKGAVREKMMVVDGKLESIEEQEGEERRVEHVEMACKREDGVNWNVVKRK